MNDEQISEIVNDIAMYDNPHDDRSRHDSGEDLSEIRQRIEDFDDAWEVVRKLMGEW